MQEDLKNNPHLDYVYTDEEIKLARSELWSRGVLYWKLDLTQRKIYDFIKGNSKKTTTLVASRRLGKSYMLLILAFEQCLQHPRSIVKFIQPEVKMIVDNIIPTIEEILIDCPPELMPELKKQGNVYRFKNGSRLQLAGTDNQNYNKLRGGDSHLALIDEAGFCSDLKKIVTSILIPTTTLTKGKIILSSTMPTDPAHEFMEYIAAAEVNGTYIKKTILDAIEENKDAPRPRFTKDTLTEVIEGYASEGGENSDAFRTEYLCIKITDSDFSVVPEFTEEIEKDTVTYWPTPPIKDTYVSMDIGFVDKTAILLAYYDFLNGVLVVEEEILIRGKEVTTSRVAKVVKEREAILWTNSQTGELPATYKRVSDNNLVFINELGVEHQMFFQATEKHAKMDYINKLRIMVADRRIIINPKCVTLIHDLKNGMWDKSKKDFKRNSQGHCDALAALAYLVRNLDENRNPYPANYRYAGKNPDKMFINPRGVNNVSGNLKELEKLANKMLPRSRYSKKS